MRPPSPTGEGRATVELSSLKQMEVHGLEREASIAGY